MKDREPSLFPDLDVSEQGPGKNGRPARDGTPPEYHSSIWSFTGSGGNQLYRWYGTLPRPLVDRLLALYAPKPARVLDLFMGLGTTLAAAADAGLAATGVDVNPLACLTAEAQLFGVPSVPAVLRGADALVNSRNEAAGPPPEGGRAWDELLAQPRYAYARKWFREDTLNALLGLLFQIAETKDKRVQRLQFVAAAQVVREVASVDPRCTHHLVTKKKPFVDPFLAWRERVREIAAAVRTEPADPRRTTVAQGSALRFPIADDSADFLLIHPPYLGVIHYHLIHRLATDLFDLVRAARSPASLRKYEFGYAAIKEADVSTDDTDRYRRFVRDLAGVARRVVAPGGRCVVVIGDQRHRGHLRHPFTDFITAFEEDGFTLEENFIWVLQNNGGMHVLRRGHYIDHNYILVFQETSGARRRTKCPPSSSTTTTRSK